MQNSLLLTIIATAALAATSFGSAQDTRSGNLEGRSDHEARGTVSIEKEESGSYRLTFAGDFFFDGAPAPVVALGKDGYDKKSRLGKLEKNTGKQTYALPSGLDPARFNEVWIWCTRFNTPLAVARLDPS